MSLPCSGISTKTKTWFTWRSSPTRHMYQWLQATVVGWQQTSPFGMLLTSKGKGYTGAVLTLLQTKKHDKSNSPIRFTISSCTAACFRSTIPSSFPLAFAIHSSKNISCCHFHFILLLQFLLLIVCLLCIQCGKNVHKSVKNKVQLDPT